ncbi:WXG100 family type VII secretion target [Brachybacterium sp. UMB0905]|uniref:WXG100 family type VII secretion target n=1 Tax=Brachybacterium sp. UMB0905 TaxID=2069310 RepID=UPI000C810296|nr:WXG100 family type VII secretion target [Brachybacterium sp. UMB0905]PMC76678.1 hypothetical protein CJ197_02830 [Brachybacterium sp. UMB0905]
MAFWGADTEQLQQQAELTGAGAKQIEDLAMRLSSTVSTVAWLGPDADDFRATWEGDLRQRLHEAAERLRQLLEELRKHAEEQDEASEPGDGSILGTLGEIFKDIVDWLENYEPLESDGFWGDLLGENGIIGLNTWSAITSIIDAYGMIPGNIGGDILNIIADAGSMGIAVYDGLQAFQDGDLFGVLDAGITYGINALDLTMTVVGMIPTPVTVAIGQFGGIATGALDIAWNAATVTAANSGWGDGSPSKMLIEAPGHAVEALTGWSGLREGTETVTSLAESGFETVSEGIRDAVPIIDPIIDLPQRGVEAVGDLLFG